MWTWHHAPRQWLIGKWSDDGSGDMDVMGEALPPGLVARVEILYGQGKAYAYRVGTYSPSQGWHYATTNFAVIAIEAGQRDLLNPHGEIGPQGRPKLLFHRNNANDPVQIKIIHYNTSGKVTRTYTWIEAREE